MKANKHNTLLNRALIIILFSCMLLPAGCQKIVNTVYVKNYKDPWHKKLNRANITEKTFTIDDVELAYAEGPDNGPALVLLHAQHLDWFSYSRVLPELSKSFHVYVIDYHGHGKTKAPATSLNANKIGQDLATFIETVIKEPVYVTGNSSGGLLTVWLAANKPELVKAIVLEDPPLFSSEYPRAKNTIAYRSFTTCHNFIEDGRTNDFLMYWLQSSSAFIEKQAGKNALPMLTSSIETYRKANPGQAVEIHYLPDMMRMFVSGMDYYDPHFGDAFYNGTWNKSFDHAEALQKIKCPTLLLQANFEVRADGVLDGAMTKEEAERAASFIENVEYKRVDAAHVINLDKPDEFIRILKDFFLKSS